jgi:SAM-dependent methyltransferase
MTSTDPAEHSRRIAAESLADDDPTRWFERLYAAAEQGDAVVPWDRWTPQQLLVDWAAGRDLVGEGRKAVVVGSGYGRDAEYIAGLGFRTVAFDISQTAVDATRRRFPDSDVKYVTATVLDLPAEWRGKFDLVVESITVQSLPPELHRQAIDQIGRLVAPGGRLIVIAAAREDGVQVQQPPWPLTRAEIESFAADGLRTVSIEEFPDANEPDLHRWLAEFERPR